MVCAAWGERMVLFGGVGLKDIYNDTFIYDPALSMWELLDCVNRPPARGGAAGALVGGSTLFIFGGRATDQFVGDAHLLDLPRRAWRLINPVGGSPPPRDDASVCTHDTYEVVLYGGSDAKGILNDLWVFNASRCLWNHVISSGDVPTKGVSGGNLQGVGNSTAVLIGGYDGDSYRSDVLALNLQTYMWRTLRAVGAVPRGRSHAVTVSPFLNGVIMCCGYAGSVAGNDIWFLRVNAQTGEAFWEPCGNMASAFGGRSSGTTYLTPRGAAGGVLVSQNRRLIVFGGCNGAEFLADTVAIDAGALGQQFSTIPAPGSHPAGLYGSMSPPPRPSQTLLEQFAGGLQPTQSPPMMASTMPGPTHVDGRFSPQRAGSPMVRSGGVEAGELSAEEIMALETAMKQLRDEVHTLRMRTVPDDPLAAASVPSMQRQIQELTAANSGLAAENAALKHKVKVLSDSLRTLQQQLGSVQMDLRILRGK